MEALDSAADAAARLADLLDKAARDLRDPGSPPQLDVASEISRFRQSFESVGRLVASTRSKAGLAPAGGEDLATLRRRLDDLRRLRADEAATLIAKAQHSLKECLRLEHAQARDFEPLQRLGRRARELLSLTEGLQPGSQLPAEVEALAEGTHAFARLLSLVLAPESLDEKAASELQKALDELWWVEVFMAAVLRKLRLREADRGASGGDSASGFPAVSAPGTSVSAPERSGFLVSEAAADTAAAGSPAGQPVPSSDDARMGASLEEGGEDEPTAARDHADDADDTVSLALWRWIGQGRPALARQLLLAQVETGRPADGPSEALLRAVIIAPHVRMTASALAQELQKSFAEIPSEDLAGNGAPANPSVLLAAAAALVPGVLAPDTGVHRILHEARLGSLHGVFNLLRVIRPIADQRLIKDVGTLRSGGDQAAWEAEMTRLQADAAAWREQQAPFITINLQRATEVWRVFLRPDGWVSRLLGDVCRDRATEPARLRELVDKLSTGGIDHEISRADRQVLHHRGPDLQAVALRQLRSKCEVAIEFARRRLRLEDARTSVGGLSGNLGSVVDKLRRDVASLRPSIKEELAAVAGGCDVPISLVSAARFFSDALSQFIDLLDPAATVRLDEPSVQNLLRRDLLRVARLRLSDDGEPVGAAEERIDLLCRTVLTTPSEAVEEKLRQADFRSARELLGEFATELSAEERDRFEERLSEGRIQAQDALRKHLVRAQSILEERVAQGLLGEDERLDWSAQLDQVEQILDNADNYGFWQQRVSEVDRLLEQKQAEEIERLRARLSVVRADAQSIERIEQVLAAGDTLAATEYIEDLASGRPLPQPKERGSSFKAFFPSTAQVISDYLEGAEAPETIRLLTNGSPIGPLQVGSVPGAQRSKAAGMLKAWYSLKRSKGAPSEQDLKALFDGLGFFVKQITAAHGTRAWARLLTETLAERDRCPLPVFGSKANGRYSALLDWDRSTIDDILQEVRREQPNQAALVLYFGRLTEARRRELAAKCREKHRSVALLDETLLLFLCGERGSRLPVFLRCALPFSYAEPYTSTAGLVPPEMFYGRERARASIMDPMGSCFIYGGRQLGKTALLRDVERRFHRPEEGRVALYLDLRPRVMGGASTGPEGLWAVLAQELSGLGVVSSSQITVQRTLLGQVRQWLDGDPGRRILLLLDEADHFLEADAGSGFGVVAALKSVMDATSRRLKVVFAGLHNVQRTTKLANHPLAHYGEPLCVGPLMGEGEARSARALIEEPLESLGYEFDNADLVTRLLSQTNYYPSLIQLYCAQILAHGLSVRWDERKTPPYVINSEFLEQVYRSQNLREAIRDRFRWTLQLDQRYEVLAYVIAWGTVEGEYAAEAGVKGLPVSWIRREALYWWREGFESTNSEDAFRVLLDEMVGLGVLRQAGPSSFALRSPNVLTLLGSKADIEQQLQDERERPLEYSPSFHRSPIGEDSRERSPLTVEQEYSLLRSEDKRVAVVVGHQLAGVERVLESLQAAAQRLPSQLPVEVFPGSVSKASFSQRVSQKKGACLFVVSAEAPWAANWAVETIRHARKGSGDRRVVFLASPDRLWQLISGDSHALRRLEEEGVAVIRLQAWHDSFLRAWLDETGHSSGPAVRRSVLHLTGGWGGAITKLVARSGPQPLSTVPTEWNHWAEEEREFVIAGLGLEGDARRWEVVQLMCGPKGATVKEVAAASGASEAFVSAVQEWAESLGLIRPTAPDVWEADPLVARLSTVADD